MTIGLLCPGSEGGSQMGLPGAVSEQEGMRSEVHEFDSGPVAPTIDIALRHPPSPGTQTGADPSIRALIPRDCVGEEARWPHLLLHPLGILDLHRRRTEPIPGWPHAEASAILLFHPLRADAPHAGHPVLDCWVVDSRQTQDPVLALEVFCLFLQGSALRKAPKAGHRVQGLQPALPVGARRCRASFPLHWTRVSLNEGEPGFKGAVELMSELVREAVESLPCPLMFANEVISYHLIHVEDEERIELTNEQVDVEETIESIFKGVLCAIIVKRHHELDNSLGSLREPWPI